MLESPGTEVYIDATAPFNTVAEQRPAFAAAPRTVEEAVAAIEEAAARGLQVVPQATGHGAGAPVGSGDLLLHTTGLDRVVVDPEARTAVVGAGATWGAVNAEAWRHGLLGPAGSSPSVAVAGYTFGGGIGWLVRRDGMAAGALRHVRYVDGDGRLRLAEDDAADPLDRDAIGVFRGGGGAGVAVELGFDLFTAADLHAGKLLWQAEHLDAVVAAWAAALPAIGPSVTTSIAVLHVPPAPPFPEALRGRTAVHLAVADPDGADGAAPLLDAVRTAAEPVADDWGPADAARLATIHLDPQEAAPSLGDARWLKEGTPGVAAALLRTAAPDDSPVVMLEIRHTAGAPRRREGAATLPAGPFLFHAVGAVGRSDPAAIRRGLDAARAVWAPVDAGLRPGSWVDGATATPGALLPDVREAAAGVADRIDPGHRIRRSRLLAEGSD